MSVWSDPTFRTECLRQLAKVVDVESLLEVPGLFGEWIETGARINGIEIPLRTTYKIALERNFISVDDLELPEQKVDSEIIKEALLTADRVELGIEATYSILSYVKSGVLKFKEMLDFNTISKLTDILLDISAPHTQINPKNFKENFTSWDKGCLEDALLWENAAEGFKRVISLAKNKRNIDDEEEFLRTIDNTVLFEKNHCPFTIYNYYDLYVFIGGQGTPVAGVIHVLDKKSMDRLYKTSSCFSSNYEYFAEYLKRCKMPYFGSPFEIITSELFRCLKEVRGNRTNYLARAFHGLTNLIYAKLSSDLVPECYDLIKADLAKDQLDHIVDYDKLIEKLFKFRLKIILEASKIYKALPSPDFDAYSALPGMEKKHNNPHEIDQKNEVLWKTFRALTIRNFVLTYHRAYNQTPGVLKLDATPKFWHAKYVENEYVVVPLTDVDDIDLRGCLKFRHYGTDWEPFVEDKTICPPRTSCIKTTNALHKTDPSDRSILQHILFNPDTLDTRKLAEELLTGKMSWDNNNLIAWKAESHKPDSRIFYMATLQSRLLISEVETNIADVLKRKTGNLMGVDPILKEATLDSIADPDNVPAERPIKTTEVLISFDLEKFSTKMPPEVTQWCYDFWEMIYDTPHISKLATLQVGSTIWCNKLGSVDNYEMTGGNLEGYNGRMMTWFHIDVMSLALREAAKKGFIVAPSQLATFIDDGSAKVSVVTSNFHDNFKGLVKTIVEVYEKMGLKVSISKTFISKKFMIMLNEVYYDGVKISPGLRAYTRVSPDYQNIVATLSEEISELYAKAQGAVKSGTSWTLSYWKYLRESVKTIFRWNRYSKLSAFNDNLKFGLWAFTPRVLGGLGLQNFNCLVTTLGESPLVEGISVLTNFGRQYNEHAELVNKILNQEIRELTGELFMRNCVGVRICGPIFVEGRATSEIIKMLKTMDISKRMKTLLEEVEKLDLATIGEAIIESGTVAKVVVENIFDMTPVSQLETFIAKFKKAKSIISILGSRTVGEIRRANLSDLKRVTAHFANMLVSI